MSCLPNVAQQVACFGVELSHRSDVVLEARGNSTLLVADGNHLKVYTFKGELVASFQDHLQPIAALCVVSCLNTRINTFPVNRLAYKAWVVLTLQDSFRVVTASRDLSLRVLTWRNAPEHGLTLESQYQLLGGSFTRSRYSVITRTNKWCSHVLYFDRYFVNWLFSYFFSLSRGFTNVACDYSSIVASVESLDGKDVLKAYTFDFWNHQMYSDLLHSLTRSMFSQRWSCIDETIKNVFSNNSKLLKGCNCLLKA